MWQTSCRYLAIMCSIRHWFENVTFQQFWRQRIESDHRSQINAVNVNMLIALSNVYLSWKPLMAMILFRLRNSAVNDCAYGWVIHSYQQRLSLIAQPFVNDVCGACGNGESGNQDKCGNVGNYWWHRGKREPTQSDIGANRLQRNAPKAAVASLSWSELTSQNVRDTATTCDSAAAMSENSRPFKTCRRGCKRWREEERIRDICSPVMASQLPAHAILESLQSSQLRGEGGWPSKVSCCSPLGSSSRACRSCWASPRSPCGRCWEPCTLSCNGQWRLGGSSSGGSWRDEASSALSLSCLVPPLLSQVWQTVSSRIARSHSALWSIRGMNELTKAADVTSEAKSLVRGRLSPPRNHFRCSRQLRRFRCRACPGHFRLNIPWLVIQMQIIWSWARWVRWAGGN